MAPFESKHAFDQAIAHHQAGRLREAEALYRQVAAHQPTDFKAHSNLGSVLHAMGQVDEAIASFRQAIALNPKLPGPNCNFGVALRAKGQLAESIAAYRRAIALDPGYAEAHFNLANALGASGKIQESIDAYQQAIAIKPDYSQAHSNLGISLEECGSREQAIACYQRAIALNPNYAQAYNNLGGALRDAGQHDDAIANYRKAIALKPDYAQAYYNLGNALRSNGQPDEAIASYRLAISQKPNYPQAYNNLGNSLKDTGQSDSAIAAYRQAMALAPEVPEYHSNLILSMHYKIGCGPREIGQELESWNLRFAEPLRKFIRPHSNERATERRLRVGYLSADFAEHVVGQQLLPLLQNHDREKFEITCYSQVRRPDPMTARFNEHADLWRSIVACSDEEVDQQIREDRIDILVDLALHSANNRLPIFARKPAPVQISYLGYCGTTGIAAMDYRFSDRYLDPPDNDLSCYTEKTVWLPRTYWCYQPWEGAAEPAKPPSLKNGYVTFGCLNNFAKISPSAIKLWARILATTPNSHIILHAPVGKHRDDVTEQFRRGGVQADRVTFVGQQPWTQYTQKYSEIDIALDPFPYGGGITTCDALWMGVPVVSLSGHTAVGRGGRSILSILGLSDLVAFTPDQYLQIAHELAGSSERINHLRKSLRARLLSSPLMDAKAFTSDVEMAYRNIWRAWCETAINR
jgi:protein O-GlcNAc transferase